MSRQIQLFLVYLIAGLQTKFREQPVRGSHPFRVPTLERMSMGLNIARMPLQVALFASPAAIAMCTPSSFAWAFANANVLPLLLDEAKSATSALVLAVVLRLQPQQAIQII